MPIFTLSSSTCFFHVFFSIPFFLWPSTSKSNALLKTWSSSVVNTWPYQRTLFTIDNTYTVSFKPNMKIKFLYLFLSLRCTPHTALPMDISVLHKERIAKTNHSAVTVSSTTTKKLSEIWLWLQRDITPNGHSRGVSGHGQQPKPSAPLTEPQALPQNTTGRHVLLLLQLSKIGGWREHQNVRQGHEALQDRYSLLQA